MKINDMIKLVVILYGFSFLCGVFYAVSKFYQLITVGIFFGLIATIFAILIPAFALARLEQIAESVEKIEAQSRATKDYVKNFVVRTNGAQSSLSDPQPKAHQTRHDAPETPRRVYEIEV